MKQKLKKAWTVAKNFLLLGHQIKKTNQFLATNILEELRKAPHHQKEKSLIPFGHKVYSQNDEDGIIGEIFNRIGCQNKVFVELGVGTGLENNTAALLLQGWSGLWVEASKKSIKTINKGLKSLITRKQLKTQAAFITQENVNALIKKQIKEKEIDLLSIDIDGNDYKVLEKIDCLSPRVIVIEYNAKFPPPITICMPYNKNHIWQGDDNMGASLSFLEKRLSILGFDLVGCNITGTNAFFVRKNLTGDHFLAPYTTENHYQPCRYDLTLGFSPGHPPSFKTLNDAISIEDHERHPHEAAPYIIQAKTSNKKQDLFTI